MNNKEFEKVTKSIQKKLGNETSALINDDLATMILDNQAMNTEIDNKNKEITDLKKDKEDLMITNSRLFQQVSIGEETPRTPEKEEKKEKFSFKSVFDEKGNFIE